MALTPAELLQSIFGQGESAAQGTAISATRASSVTATTANLAMLDSHGGTSVTSGGGRYRGCRGGSSPGWIPGGLRTAEGTEGIRDSDGSGRT